jgi:hypothetical protein
MPKLVPVSGTVTVNGKPLEGALVSFQPDLSAKSGLPAQDVTGPDGNYLARTKGRSGVVPGKYHVVVTKSLLDASKAPAEFKDDPFMAQLSQGPLAEKTPAQREKEQIEQSFDCEIPPEGGVQDFDVKRKSK